MAEEEIPIEITSYSRIKHLKWNKGKKANVCICGNFNPGWSKEIKCEECGDKCFYSGNKDCEDLKKKNIKKICLNCALTKYKKYINEEQLKILELGVNE